MLNLISIYETHFIQNPLIPFFKIENFKFFIKIFDKNTFIIFKNNFFLKN